MSYEKAMKFARNPKKGKAQPLGFNTLGENKRRREPWLGGCWFAEGMDEEREQYINKYHEETERLIKLNPDLQIVD